MITKIQKERIKDIIGNKYVSLIKEKLKEKGVLNKKGKAYKTSFIINVMNGKGHKIIENAIYDVVAEKKEELEQQKKVREGLLNNE